MSTAFSIVVDGCRAGNNLLICRFFWGVFHLRPSQPQQLLLWDAKPELQQLRTMHPLDYLSLEDLTLKVVMLIALTQAARVWTLHFLMLRNISIGENSISVWLSDNIKQCRPKFSVQFITFHVYTQDKKIFCYLFYNTRGILRAQKKKEQQKSMQNCCSPKREEINREYPIHNTSCLDTSLLKYFKS